MQNQPMPLIELVREGMTVIDADGEKLGTVEYIKMSDAGVGTLEGGRTGFRDGRGLDTVDDEPTRPGVVFTPGAVSGAPAAGTLGGLGAGALAPVETTADARAEERMNVFEEPEPDVNPALRRRLLQRGFIKIDGYGPGFLDTDRYVPADQIARVEDDNVHLLVRKGEIATEQS